MSVIDMANVHALRLYVNDTYPELITTALLHCPCVDTANELLIDSFIYAILYCTKFKDANITQSYFFEQVSRPYKRKLFIHQRSLLVQLANNCMNETRIAMKYEDVVITAVERSVFMSMYLNNLSTQELAHKYNLTLNEVCYCYEHVARVLNYAVVTLFVL